MNKEQLTNQQPSIDGVKKTNEDNDKCSEQRGGIVTAFLTHYATCLNHMESLVRPPVR